jgi:hypothetical protein
MSAFCILIYLSFFYFLVLPPSINIIQFKLSFNPHFEDVTDKECDLLILLDRSCSMEGEAMQDLRRILRALISNLPSVVRFSALYL